MKTSNPRLVFLGLLLCVLLVAIIPFFGAESLSWKELLDPNSVGHRIFFELRVPRLCLTLLVGAVLAILGGTYQILFHNPLAEPYVLGISSAVTLGIGVAECFFKVQSYSPQALIGGFVGGAIATLLIVSLALSRMGDSADHLVLFGMALNFVLSSALFLLLSYSYQHMGGGSLRWLFGQIPWASRREVGLLALAAIPLSSLIIIFSRRLDALAFGDTVARTLGFHPARARALFLAVSSLLLTVTVFFTGSIGFVGLVVPHAVRLVFRPSSARQLLLFSMVVGATFLAFSDLFSRMLLPPFEFPIGIITTLCGGPLFLYLLWRR